MPSATASPLTTLGRGAAAALLTALAYAAVGWLAVKLAESPSYASPMYPSAGIALAAALIFGRYGVLGAGLGAFIVNLSLAAARGQLEGSGAAAALLPAAIGLGAALQASVGLLLMRRLVGSPLTLAVPRDIVRFGVFGGALACLVNASWSTFALSAAGAVPATEVANTWWTWWVGDLLGVLVGAPIALTLIGLPRSEWAPRRLSVGLPMLTGTALLALALWLFNQWEDEHHLAGNAGHTGTWLFSIVGLVATALLGLLLLTVTGRARRVELAVEERTQALTKEVEERSAAEAALRDSEQRQRDILDHVPIGVMFLDTHGAVLEVNPRICQMLQRSADELRCMSATDLVDPSDVPESRMLIASLLGGHIPVAVREIRLRRADGSGLQARATITVLHGADGRAQRLVGVLEDITEHLRLAETERARDAAQASNRAKSEFVSRMSHELRTPLNAILGFAQLLGMDRQPALAPPHQAWTAQIQRAGWHLLEMINDTLDLARIESGAVELNVQAVELAPLVGGSIALVSTVADKRGITFTETLDARAAAVMGDETRLRQVLTNLLSNAVKYNRDGGSITIGSRLAGNGRLVEISVQDTGLGMSAEQFGALFQPYNRLGREASAIEGTGIGLVISRRLAELMGGALEATSTQGVGSTFTLRLPRAAFTDSGSPLRGVPEEQRDYRRRVVHYIEDNETNVEVMRGILAQRPQIALEVSLNGLDGLAAVKQRRPDLILLDMQLPDIGGLELLRHLKNDDAVADIPVLVVSADATQVRIEEALTLGAAQYLTKPVDITSFLQMIDQTLTELDTRWG